MFTREKLHPQSGVVKDSLNRYVHHMGERRYRLGERARKQEATRRRIVEATAALHAEVGPAATTISAIAERAGVQRLTVYRHFPEERQLFEACSALSEERHPSPDPAVWVGIADPRERTEAALGALYRYYAADEQGLGLVLRDAEELPVLREVLAPFVEFLDWIAEDIGAAWAGGMEVEGAGGEEMRGGDAGDEADRARRVLARLAVDFGVWRALAWQGVEPAEAASMMAGVVAAGGEGGGQRRS